ncbi:MAG: Gfo/Idh/MocA family oxidoreductase [Bacteroidales bacterium]|nr:Gfo/Idh/MocA family oxidoreductase [Bacteroidales bacterium]
MQINRRNFLKSGLITGSAFMMPTIIPSCAFGSNDQITIGMIGTGSHGIGWNLAAYLKLDDCRVIAACDVDNSRVLKAKSTIDKKYRNRDCRIYNDFRELLERNDIDAVQISSPDHWHVLMSIMAIQKKKDVCCEKPTLTIKEGRLLSDCISRSDQIYQTSLEDRSVFQYHRMAELVRNGRIGRLQRIRVGLPGVHNLQNRIDTTIQPVPEGFDYEMWLGPAPYAPYSPGRCHGTFRYISEYSGGSLTDWGAHLLDTAQRINGTEKSGPIEVKGNGINPNTGIFDTFEEYNLTYKYENGVILDVHSNFVELYCEGTDGWLLIKGWSGPLESSSEEILNSVIGDNEIHLDTDSSEHENFLKCIKTRTPVFHPVEDMHRTSTLTHIGNIAMKLQRKLKWDPVNEEFINDFEANSMRNRVGRAPWVLEDILK